ncbi:MAG: hypothetical protein J5J00_13665 [Deltaproteobacteria bacterium]|nr:hypothetical protein [Deltaproteobacteria bacterium]
MVKSKRPLIVPKDELSKLQYDYVTNGCVTSKALRAALERDLEQALPISEVCLFKFVSCNAAITAKEIGALLDLIRTASEMALHSDHDLFMNYCKAMTLCSKEMARRAEFSEEWPEFRGDGEKKYKLAS